MKKPPLGGLIMLDTGEVKSVLCICDENTGLEESYIQSLPVSTSPDYPRKNCCALFLSLAVENSKTTVTDPLSGLELNAATVTTYDRIPHWGQLVPGYLFVPFKGFSLNTNQRGGKWVKYGLNLKSRVNLC